MVQIIPLGINCGMAETLKRLGKRQMSHPLDWVVSFDGIAKLFDKSFVGFLPTKKYVYPNNDEFFWSDQYGIIFRHDNFPESTEKYERRIKRLFEILDTTKEHVLFIRKCHQDVYHSEVQHHNILNEDDVQDIIDFEAAIRRHFPHLSFRVVAMLRCPRCYLHWEPTSHFSDNIRFYNISELNGNDEEALSMIVMKEIAAYEEHEKILNQY